MNFRFDQPELLLWLLLAVPIVWLGMRSLAALEPTRRWTAIVLRLLVLTILVFMLAGFQGVTKHSDLTVIVVRDTSESVRRFAQVPNGSTSVDAWLNNWVRAASKGKRQTDRFGMVTYDQRAMVRILPSEEADPDTGASISPMDGTNTAAGLRAGMAIVPGDTAGRILLVTDGNDTAGELLTEASGAAAAGLIVDVLPIEYNLENEVMVEAVYAPTDAREGQTAGIRVVLRATRPSFGTLSLLHDENLVGSGYRVTEDDWSVQNNSELEDGEADHGARYIAVKQLDLPLDFAGVNRFRAIFEPDEDAGGDTVAVNNNAEAFTLVAGEGRVLLVNNLPSASGDILPRALRSRGIVVDVIDAYAMPSRMSELQRYDAVLFQNVPNEQITGAQQRMIAKYVNDLGGGFAMIGGPDSFAAGAWTNTPIDRILPVECQIPSQSVLPSGALVLVIDRSGSMSSPVAGTNRSQQELANEAAVLALSTLFPQDLVGVVVFDGGATWIVKVQENLDPGGTAKLVRSIQPQGGTNIYSGLEEAYRALAPMNTSDAAVRHVILLTDGNSSPPPGGSYTKLVADMMRADITLSTIGVGDGHDGTLLNQLAQMGGGTYHPITNPNNLPQIFIKEAKTLRKNLIKEGEFTPGLRATGSPIMTNINAVPNLQGFVLTGPKSDPRVFTPITGPEGEPIFAHWQVGLGRSAAFTSDATNRWAVDWLGWEGYADFWARTIRTIARPTQSHNADLVTDIRGDSLSIRLDTAADETSAKFSRVAGSILQPDGTTTEVILDQTGPGLFEASLPAQQSGNYIVSLFLEQADGTREAVFGGISRPPGSELRRFQSNLPLLRRVAEITGGTVYDAASMGQVDLFTRDHDFVTRSVRPLWRTLLILLLVLLLLDVACRRIAWDAVAIAAWFKTQYRHMLGSRQVESESTLAALKNRRATVRAAQSETGEQVDRTRKFQADESFVAMDKLTEAVGGATEDTNQPIRERKQSDSNDAQDDGSTTSRLLAAKRRTRTD